MTSILVPGLFRVAPAVKRRATRFLQERAVRTSREFDEAFDRSLWRQCKRYISHGRDGDRRCLLDPDAEPIYLQLQEQTLEPVCRLIETPLSGTILELAPPEAGLTELDLSVRVRLDDGEERRLPPLFFEDHSFQRGDRFHKAAGDQQATPGRAVGVPAEVGEDWRFLWSQYASAEFLDRYWGQYVAVFQREVVADGPSDETARAAALGRLGERPGPAPSAGRLVVAFVGDDERW